MASETEHKVNQGLLLTCAKCSTKNFLDPYPFWNFQGNTKCAGCDTLYAVKFVKGQQVSGPTVSSGKADLLPGYAEDKTGAGITGEGKIRPAPQARPDPFSGKQKQITKSHRGKPVSGSPLFVIEKKGSQLFINGNRILDPIGRTSVSRSKLRAAVREVAGRRK